MSRQRLPKQLIPLFDGRSLLQIAAERLDGLIDPERLFVCAGQVHQAAVQDALMTLGQDRFIGEPMGRDTLNAAGLGAAVIGRDDPDAVIGVFTADHLIEPVVRFREIVSQGFELVESHPDTLVTFGIQPTGPATGYGYLELGSPVDGAGNARLVTRFKEKPDRVTAHGYFDAGSDRYLWNSGMFVWQAATLLGCVNRYKPANGAGLSRIGQAWDTPDRNQVLNQVYPTLEKVSIDYAVMEPAAADPQVRVAAVPMPLEWLDVGSWPAYAQTCETDSKHNAVAAKKHVTIDTHRTLLASSDPDHLIATIGCEDLIIVHTPDATLVCRADRAEEIKRIHQMASERFGDEVV